MRGGKREFYEFTWPGKKASILESNASITKTLRPSVEDSKNWESTKNLYIEGDNLEVLKILREGYLGKVKMIYIDPPYNTGNDFIYKDKFSQSKDKFSALVGQKDEAGNILFSGTNQKSNPRFHSDWCSMIFSRLLLARNLLTDDGVIYISIDDNEQDNLMKICGEVFGEENMVACIPWQSRASIQNDTDFSINHEYICVYAKNRRKNNRRLKDSNKNIWFNKDSFVCSMLPLDKDKFSNLDNDPRGLWKADPFDAPNVRPNLTYKIKNPLTGEYFLPPQGRCWRTEEKSFIEYLKDNRIIFGKDGKGRPQLKVFYSEKAKFGSVDNSWFASERVGTATQGTKELMEIFNGIKFFDTPKPLRLIKKLISLAGVRSSDIVLDFFSGSATTAHAVMQLNAEDGGNRQFIMVQLPESCAENSEAFKAGYKNICEIGKERIRRAGEQIKKDHPESKVDVGFRVFKVDSSNMKDVYYNPESLSQDLLLSLESNVKEDRSDLDLLFGCILDLGLTLDKEVKEETIGNTKVYIYNDDEKEGPDLIACFAESITEDVITAIAKRNPLKAVFKDSSFENSPSKINLFELFKTYANISDDNELQSRVRVI